jgi:hypothetical protein
MHNGRFIFSELIAHLPPKEFQKCVARYDGGSQWRKFSYWDQYLTMAFAQLTYRESLRDIEACLRSVTGKLYHLGFAAGSRVRLWPTPTNRATAGSLPTSPMS